MREIKFRIKTKHDNKIVGYEWVGREGHWETYSTDLDVDEKGEIIRTHKNSFFRLGTEVIREMFTGLKDSKGVEIYENDIVELLYADGTIEKFTVVYYEEKARFMLRDDDAKWWFDTSAELRVIGNKYEGVK